MSPSPMSNRVNRSELTYKSQRRKLPDIIAACSQLNVKALNKMSITICLGGDLKDSILMKVGF